VNGAERRNTASFPKLTARAEVLERRPGHDKVAVANDEYFVQDGVVADEALRHAGGLHVGQRLFAKDDRHLRASDSSSSCANSNSTHLVSKV